jgi:hypothetical protein
MLFLDVRDGLVDQCDGVLLAVLCKCGSAASMAIAAVSCLSFMLSPV